METVGPGIHAAINPRVAVPVVASDGTWKSSQYRSFCPGQPIFVIAGNLASLATGFHFFSALELRQQPSVSKP
jgi:hypothetical protein